MGGYGGLGVWGVGDVCWSSREHHVSTTHTHHSRSHCLYDILVILWMPIYRWEIYTAVTWPLIWNCKLCWELFLSFQSRQLTGTFIGCKDLEFIWHEVTRHLCCKIRHLLRVCTVSHNNSLTTPSFILWGQHFDHGSQKCVLKVTSRGRVESKMTKFSGFF